jgi:hypothetical protein
MTAQARRRAPAVFLDADVVCSVKNVGFIVCIFGAPLMTKVRAMLRARLPVIANYRAFFVFDLPVAIRRVSCCH